MKIQQFLIIALSIIIGIGLIPVIGALSDGALSGETETVEVEKNIVYEDLPIEIKAGDTLVMPLPEIRSNILFTIYIQNGEDPTTRWGFATSGSGRDLYINNTPFRFEEGTWDNPTFVANASTEWYTWVVVDDVGTLTFLQDFPVEIDTIQASTGQVYTEYPQPTSYSTDVLTTTIEVPVYTSRDRLVMLLPFIAVVFLISASVIYIKFKH